MSEIRLYWYWTTNPQKVRFALEELSLPYECITINLGKGEQKNDDFLRLNPRGQVPVLELDGNIICESNAIVLALAEHAKKKWPIKKKQLSKAYELMFLESGTFSSLAGIHFYNLIIRKRLGQSPNIQAVLKARKKLIPHLRRFEEHFSKGHPYLLSEFSLVDCIYGVWLPHICLKGFPHVQAWRSRLMARPAWTTAQLRQDITPQPTEAVQ